MPVRRFFLARSPGPRYNSRMKQNHSEKKKSAAILIPTAVLLLLTLPGFYQGLTVRHYSLDTGCPNTPVKAALLSDLHSCRYGKEQEKLIGAIQKESPDLVLLAGDIRLL